MNESKILLIPFFFLFFIYSFKNDIAGFHAMHASHTFILMNFKKSTNVLQLHNMNKSTNVLQLHNMNNTSHIMTMSMKTNIIIIIFKNKD